MVFTRPMFAGLDFGTTNCALAFADHDGEVTLTRYDVRGQSYDTFRSVLYFDPDKKDGPGHVTCGIEGIHAYLGSDGRGRFVQSIKSHLASRLFHSTTICNRRYSLEDLITQIVTQLEAKARRPLPEQVVVGRPVHFVNDDNDSDGDARAEERLRRAIVAAGFKEVRFELEPVAAAYQYETRLKRDEIVLIADFGGGTTDLCLVDVGPGVREEARRQSRRAVRATDGVALAGDTFDQRIIHHAVAPLLGLGTKYRVFGGDADVPLWLYTSLSRWHLLSFLKTQKTMQLMEEIVANAHEPERLARFQDLIDDDLGYALHQAVEGAKRRLSDEESTRIDFVAGGIDRVITRQEFDAWIADDLQKMADAVDRVLAAAFVKASKVNRVFMTGGTSLVPAVRRLFADRFGERKLRGGEEMTSVGRGLALVARDVFGPRTAS